MALPVLLQLCPLIAALEADLESRFVVHRWFELSDPEQWLSANATDVTAVATGGHVGISASLMTALPALRIVAINGVGFDKVDLDLARARGVRVTNTPEVLTDDVADLTIGLIVALSRGLVAADGLVRAGRWPDGNAPLGHKASGRRYGILGLGRIGRAIARRLESFGGEIAYTAPTAKPVAYRFFDTALDLARNTDVFIVASSAALNAKPLVDRAVIEAIGPSGLLINIARGSLVDEDELTAALLDGRLGGAALDVFADEPRVSEALRGAPNVVLTPHIGTATVETRAAMAALVLANLDAAMAGRPLVTPVF